MHHGHMRVAEADPILDAPDSYEHVREVMDRGSEGLTAEPVTALDVAAALLEAHGGKGDTWWLQKMTYVVQAMHLKANDEPLYRDPIEAWRDGPVVPELYRLHPRAYAVTQIRGGNLDRFTQHPTASATLRRAMAEYGLRSGTELVQLTHDDPPWLAARAGLDPDQPSDRPISVESITAGTKFV